MIFTINFFCTYQFYKKVQEEATGMIEGEKIGKCGHSQCVAKPIFSMSIMLCSFFLENGTSCSWGSEQAHT